MPEKGSSQEPFQLVAGHPALDFVNSLDDRFQETGPLELLADYADLLRFVAQAGLITKRQLSEIRKFDLSLKERNDVLAEAVRLREALAATLYAALVDQGQPARTAVLDLEAIFKEAAWHRTLVSRRIRHAKSSPELTWEYKDVTDVRSPVWLVAQAANDLLTSPQAIHIRTCLNSTCRWLFLDTSKNHSRRWCDMKICGNRIKARRFHLRQGAGLIG